MEPGPRAHIYFKNADEDLSIADQWRYVDIGESMNDIEQVKGAGRFKGKLQEPPPGHGWGPAKVSLALERKRGSANGALEISEVTGRSWLRPREISSIPLAKSR